MREFLHRVLIEQPMKTFWGAVGDRWQVALRRSVWDAAEALAQQMWRYVIPGSLLAALASIVALDLAWDKAAIAVLLATLLTYPLIFAVTFLGNLVGNYRSPDHHKDWVVERPQVVDTGVKHIRFALIWRHGDTSIGRYGAL